MALKMSIELFKKNGDSWKLSDAQLMIIVDGFSSQPDAFFKLLLKKPSAIPFCFRLGLKRLFNVDRSEKDLSDLYYSLGINHKEWEKAKVTFNGGKSSFFMNFGPSIFFIRDIFAIVEKNNYGIKAGFSKGKIFVDAGANLGIFSLYVAALGADKIYSFEPVKSTFELLSKNFGLNSFGKKIVLVQLGLGDKECNKVINYSGAGDAGASFFRSGTLKDTVGVTTLDKFFANKKKPDFIKMDVEGSELEILNGASRIIKTKKPVLSFSGYHNPEDAEQLPRAVKKLNNKYACVILQNAEKVIFCS